MLDLHAKILEKDGKKEFAVIPYEEFLQIQEELADYDDLRILREAKQKESDAPGLTMEEMKKELGMKRE